ncbi:MAG TPA: TonB-dependent receptor [Bryobacteraceae bacterium]|nr:TonB-dependent receptor [Bryobacteraceae bacterium]
MRSRCLFIAVVVPILSAQTYTGSISGKVTDSSGSVVPKAVVTLTEEATNTVLKTATGDSGDYILSYLKPGNYQIQFAAAGFKEHVETGILLQINQSRRVDPVLQVGDVTEVVQVSVSAAQVNYVSPEIGQVVDADQLINLPEEATNSRGRSPFLLAKLLPGVTTNGNTYTNINGFSFAGGRRVTNEILVDGLPTTNPSDETYTLTPSPDSIQEFKVLTTPFSAEYGHTGGGVMIATSRSGGNALHGSAYDLFRNRLLNTRDFFSPAQSSTKYVQNDPGGTIGGPVVIPHLYNGKDKTFFFVDFNVTLASQGSVTSALVPTDLQKSGDFSQTFSGGQLVQIYDPTTNQTGPDGKTVTRSPFPGNVIPASRIDPVAAQIVKFYPEPNWSAGANNYVVTPPNQNDNWQYLGRIDQNFGANDRAFFRFGQYSPNSNATVIIPNKANNQQAGGWTDTQAVMNETHIFNATLVSDFRFGWVQEDNYSSITGGPAPELGLKGVDLNSFPVVSVSQMIGLGAGAPSHDRDRSWVFNEAMTWSHGRHTIKFGGDFRRQMYNNYSPGKQSGSYSFSNTFTTSTPNDTKSGFGIADLLLGLPASTSFNIDDYTFRENIDSAGAFVQDDFKINRRLTLNLGLRWEWDGPYSEANNQFASFAPLIVNHITGNLGDVQFAGRNGAPTHFSPNIYHDFLPRIGFAYNVLPNTVLRGGYGIYRLPAIGYYSYGPVSQYAQSATFTSPDNNVTPAIVLANGIPPIPYNVDTNGNPSIPASLTKPTSNVTQLESRARTPYNQTWQLGLQHQFGSNWLAEVDYVGTRGVKLPITVPENQLPFSEWGVSGNPQSLRPFPQYLNVTWLENNGNSLYNALQASLQRRWSSGVLSFAYTWAKITDDVDGPASSSPIQDIYNLKAEHGIASYDVPQRFVANYVYRIPLGRGSKLLAGVPVVQDVVRGWEISGVTEMQIGLPLAVTQNNGTGGFTGTQRPEQIAPAALSRGDRTLSQWFNTNAFVVAPPFTAGTEPRFSLFGPGINNWDTALMRNFPVRERVTVQLRGEFYNTFNHPNFKNPNTTLGNVNYGKITGDNGARVTEVALRIFF